MGKHIRYYRDASTIYNGQNLVNTRDHIKEETILGTIETQTEISSVNMCAIECIISFSFSYFMKI